MHCYWHVVDGNSPNICGVHCNWEFYSPYLHLPSTQRTLQTTTNLLSFRQKLMLKKYSFWQCPLSTQHCWHMQHWKNSLYVKILCKFWVFAIVYIWVEIFWCILNSNPNICQTNLCIQGSIGQVAQLWMFFFSKCAIKVEFTFYIYAYTL